MSAGLVMEVNVPRDETACWQCGRRADAAWIQVWIRDPEIDDERFTGYIIQLGCAQHDEAWTRAYHMARGQTVGRA